MKAAELRQSILQAAVQGKLVPQNLQDKPACELFERIQNEKAHLIKEGKIKKAPPLPEIAANEMPFEIPENWCWVRLGQLTELITSGSRDWAKYYTSTGDIFLRMGNLSRNRFDLRLDKIQYVKLPKNIEGMRTSVQAGDLLFSITGEIGTLGLIPDNFGTAYINQHTAIIRFMTSEKSKFYPYVLLSDYAQKFYNGNQHGIKNSFRLDTIALLPVPLPPLGEQHRIVSKIDELFALCDKLEIAEKRLTALEEHFTEYLPKAILQAAVQGKLVPQNSHDEPASELLKRIQQEKAQLAKEGKIKKEKPLPPISEEEIPYDLPEGWVWCRTADICSYIQRGKSPTYSDTKMYPVVSQKCVQWDGIDMSKARFIAPETMSKYEENRLLQTGDLLWNSTGQGTLGRIAIYDKQLNSYQCAVADSHVTILRPMHILPQYMYYWFAGPEVQGTIDEKATGSTKQIELATLTIMSHILPLPPLAEQLRIVSKVDELRTLCDELKAAYTAAIPLDKIDNIIPFPSTKKEKETLLAARGDVGQLSNEAMQAIDDLFAEDEE